MAVRLELWFDSALPNERFLLIEHVRHVGAILPRILASRRIVIAASGRCKDKLPRFGFVLP